MFIDTHAHLDMKDFSMDLEEVLERALKGEVTHIISVGIDLESSLKSLELSSKYNYIYSSVGYHPHNTDELDESKLEEIFALASESKVVAWGEIGLDYFREYSTRFKQVEGFERQLEMAGECGLPIIVHDRDAHMEIFKILKKHSENYKGIDKGVIHCFSGDYDLAMSFIEMGYYISIPGTVTYKNAKNVQDVASRIPVDFLLIETDAPYLAPIPKRGKRNEPFFMIYTAQKIAQIRKMDIEDLSRITTSNAKRLFGLI